MTKINGIADQDLISRLPVEVLQLILLNLNPNDLRTCERVSRLFQKQSRNEDLWKEKINKYHIHWKKEQGSARLAVLRFFKPKPTTKPTHELQIYRSTLRTDLMI